MQKILKAINSFRTKFILSGLLIIVIFSVIELRAENIDVEESYKIRTVVIDPGHGGKDPGALGSAYKEKDVVLAIGLKLGKYIEENYPDIKVIYTRSTDVFIPLHERANIANKAKADLFISIHANSNTNKRAYGTETYVMGLHKSEDNLEVAMKENSVITYEEDYQVRYEGFNPDDVESYIMMSVMQDTYLDQSLSAAALIQDQFRERAVRKDRGVKQAGFLVLWKTSMPSILIETGFLSNPSEEAYLASEQGQDYLASAIFRAFRDYKNVIESRTMKNTGSTLADANSQEIAPDAQSEKEVAKVIAPATTTEVIEIEDISEPLKPKPENKEKTDIVENNIYFKVQITSSSGEIATDSEIFKDFNDIEEFKMETGYKYAVGYKNNYEEIVEYSKFVKNRFPDAFIIAVKDGNIIPLDEALKLKN